jgi:thiamine-phosphate pyrophosphorylase
LEHDAELRASVQARGLNVQQLEDRLKPAPIALDEPLTLLEPTEQIDTARILDANANRAREALRTLEDYCRFVLDDATLSGELKRLRHDLASALSLVNLDRLLEARETQHDVGVSLTTPTEEQRASPLAVVQAACKRLQEALRSLEEYGKLYSTDLGRAVEVVRYRSYTVERALFLGSSARARLAEAQLYVLITGSACLGSLEWTIKEAVAGGAQLIQLREKQLPDRELLERARRVRHWTHEAGALFIMNDRPDLARLSEADGVHVGQDELSVKDVRRIVGPEILIGVSTHDPEQLRQAILDGASYVGVGPTFPSATKAFPGFAGLEFVRQAAALTTLPAFAIGGITLENVDQVVAAGLRRVAVSRAICQAEEPRQAAAQFQSALGSRPA